MKDRLLSTFLGALLGFCIPLFVYVLIFEHITLFVLLPFIPITGIVVGAIIGLFRIIPPLKIWVSLLIFTIVISTTIGFSKARIMALQKSRESFALHIANQVPDVKIDEIRYQQGNGMETPPNVHLLISSEKSFEEMANLYNKILVNNKWVLNQGSWFLGKNWRRGDMQVYMGNNPRDIKDSDFWLTVDFYGNWVHHIRAFE